MPRWATSPSVSVRIIRNLAVACALLATLAGAAFVLYANRVPLAAEAAELWIVEDAPERADAVVVLGGGLDRRPQAAAELLKNGFASRVLVPELRESYAAELGVTPSETEVTIRLLNHFGVSRAAIEVLPGPVTSTRDEAEAVRRWVAQHRPKRLLVPTNAFHTRRARYIFDHELRGTGVDSRVLSLRSADDRERTWWRSEYTMLEFQNELVKLLYYVFTS